MTIETTQDVQGIYDKFNTGDIAGILADFAPDAVYNQAETGQSARGPQQIGALMAMWPRCFEGARVENMRVVQADERAGEQPGAVKCFQAHFDGVGRYVETLPKLEHLAKAHHDNVRLPLTEVIWVNDAGQVVRVENTFSIAALH